MAASRESATSGRAAANPGPLPYDKRVNRARLRRAAPVVALAVAVLLAAPGSSASPAPSNPPPAGAAPAAGTVPTPAHASGTTPGTAHAPRTAPAGSGAPAAFAAGGGAVLYRFESFARDGAVTDHRGADNNAVVAATAGGAIRPAPRGTGHAAVFPDPCQPTGQRCPRAILESPHRPALNPGTGPIRYGATLRLPASHTGAGENVIQKGSYRSGSQWKLQVDGTAGAPSCVLVGNGRAYRARSSARVADGRWHRVECRRAGATLTVLLDGVATGRTAIPGTLNVSNPAPLRVGGNGAGQHNDQFFGSLDDVFVIVG